jgi:uncharacterized protein (TIGR02147 family)
MAHTTDVFGHRDYRAFLKDAFERHKKTARGFSYRKLGKCIGFSPGYFSRLLAGDKNLSMPMAARIAAYLHLNKRETGYFLLLVRFGNEKRADKKAAALERMLSCAHPSPALISRELYAYYSDWRHSALRAFVAIAPVHETSDVKTIGKMFTPALTPPQVRASLSLLRALGLIAIDDKGQYRLTDHFVSTGEDVYDIAIQKFFKKVNGLADRALTAGPVSERSFSAMTVGISGRGYDRIKTAIAEFRRQLHQIVREDTRTERVYQINFQLFPLSRRYRGDHTL